MGIRLRKKRFKVLLIMLLLLPLAGVGLVYAYLKGFAFLQPLIGTVYLAFGAILVMVAFELKRYQRFFYGGAAVLVGGTAIYSIPPWHEKTRPVISEAKVDILEYLPFQEGSNVMTLNEPSSFSIKDDIPVIDGDTALYPVYSAFAQAVYPEKDYDPHDSEVMSNQTGEALDNLITGKADMIFVKNLSITQLETVERAGKELISVPIGQDAFVFFVHAKNSVESLTKDEIRGIYSGWITNWKDIGGNDEPIRAFQQPADSRSQIALEWFMGNDRIMDAPQQEIASLTGTTIGEVSDYQNDKNAIGFTFRHDSTEMMKNNDIKLLKVEGIEPSDEMIKKNVYPIPAHFSVVTTGTDNPHVEAFIEWMRSKQGQEIVEKTGYVPVREWKIDE
ncbi:PstS family phosphate ABC transporter substrate-binding protein [Sporosarcina sp. Te-1]|uniref:PstS family phosphate ABC transporter substrate-binding protein n=1 Tax=Sporosarcina sp. Te-1 TaxID=2818390 RepID=UPI001A9D3443|nr:substrate-binding domain-containing protein [Sporosarcina sp. Te-1]QTD39754.1 substrate-binding domain-containing protein [Sporosarcina sp. Te-1]